MFLILLSYFIPPANVNCTYRLQEALCRVLENTKLNQTLSHLGRVGNLLEERKEKIHNYKIVDNSLGLY